MSGTITNQTLAGVSVNAFHLNDGDIQVSTLEFYRRTSKSLGGVASDAGNFGDVYTSKATSAQALVDTDGDVITSVRASRSSSTVTLVFDPAVDMTSGASGEAALTSLMDDLEGIFISPQANGDYSEPATDAPKYNFVGEYVYAESGTLFNVTDMSLV